MLYVRRIVVNRFADAFHHLLGDMFAGCLKMAYDIVYPVTGWYFLLPQARGGASVLPLPAGWVPAGLGIWGGGGGCPPQAGRGPCLLPHWQELDLVLEPPGIGTRAFLGFLLLFLMP